MDASKIEVEVTGFEAFGDGYLIAFAGPYRALYEAARAVRMLDPWQRCRVAGGRAWWIGADAISLLARRLPAVADAFERWRARPAGARIDAGMEDLWRSLMLPSEVAAAYARLGLPPGASSADVKAARRRLARSHHPDAGGEHAAMAAVNAAADTVAAWLARSEAPAPAFG
jgi:hypothetical protein